MSGAYGFLPGDLKNGPLVWVGKSADLHLGHVVRMQEEIGTGGGGFRFMFGAFLQESAEEIQNQSLHDCASSLTTAGDAWREFAAMAARVCKDRARPGDTYTAMAEQIRNCASTGRKHFQLLSALA